MTFLATCPSSRKTPAIRITPSVSTRRLGTSTPEIGVEKEEHICHADDDAQCLQAPISVCSCEHGPLIVLRARGRQKTPSGTREHGRESLERVQWRLGHDVLLTT